ncbi:uncharacterized protein ASPGLDRAFT_39882 [Aspergillus glaucus CBS 516.65]|uniref:Uncharacterized protein n=1 Tax=Aspergillus glaucus CBS 516.65 TaxID=1160497 RepID=A0A1L9V6U5_ASPGL|nr:hypothetical protein ASPGLDRAFT_39882 [Aspergillus glaucus CBS 516.65]OJJ79572.1 hypothetical protein ASPGLDRAFT_39882 [Aspergillus glaucus CBS 516.65]
MALGKTLGETRSGHVEGTTSYAWDASPDSEYSSKSDEDKNEEVTRVSLGNLIGPIHNHDNFPSVQTTKYTYYLSTGSQPMRNWLGQRSPVIAKSDGSGFLIHGRWISGSRRFDEIPVISFEAKRRHAARMLVGNWKEGYCKNILGQEVAELLGQAIESSRQVSTTTWVDQEAFVISVRATN